MKSILVSVIFPAWMWIHFPDRKFLGVTNEQGLAIRDALRMKWVIESEWFQGYWPLKFQKDQKQKTLFMNERKGSRQSLGINSNITGKRGDSFLYDKISNITSAGGTLSETETIPKRNYTIVQDSLSITEYGNSIPFTLKGQTLAEIELNVPTGFKLEDCKKEKLDKGKIVSALESYGFFSLIKRLPESKQISLGNF